MLGLFLPAVVASGSAHAESAITVTITDSSANLNLVSADNDTASGESDTASFTVSTTSSGGYTTTVSGSNSEGKLTGTSSANYFTSIASATEQTSSFSNGTWGFKPNKYNSSANTNFRPVPTSSTPATIDVTNAPTTGSYTISVGAKTDTTTAADNYSYDFIVAAVTNSIDYDIVFANAASGMPERMSGSQAGNTVTLPSTEPTMAGYAFGGWCTVSVSPGSACTGTIYQAGGTYTLASGSNNDVTLYAIWEAVKPLTQMTRMDEMTTAGCEASAVGDSNSLIDDRGTASQTYTVKKLADGKCWMTQNMRLTYNDTDALAVSDGAGGTVSWTPSRATYTSKGTWNYSETTPDSYYGGNTTRGAYYNWTAAIASNDSESIYEEGEVVNTSICPKGWKLPQNAEGTGSWYTLYQNYNSFALMQGDPGLVLAGGYEGATFDVNESGYYWSNTMAYDYIYAYYLYLTSSIVEPQEYQNERFYGHSVRCVSI